MNKEQLVSIPKEIAEWIESTKQTTSLYGAMKNTKLNEDVDTWMTSPVNQEIFARAWLDGYEVSKEKQYFVYIKNTYQYLEKNELSYRFSSLFKDSFTEKELRDSGFGWVFDCQGIGMEVVK